MAKNDKHGAPVDDGAPPGMTPEGVEERSALARRLENVQYPAKPGQLTRHAQEAGAPDETVEALKGLPDRSYNTLGEVAEALGFGHESRRF
jgi:hypothetical protein